MKTIILFFSALLVCSCTSQKIKVNIVKQDLYEYKEVTFFIQKIDSTYKYGFFLPLGYKEIKTISGNGYEVCYIYSYNDSIYIYLSNDFNPNFDNIGKLGEKVLEKRFESIVLKTLTSAELGRKYYPESIITEGVIDSLFYWKDLRKDYVSFGYLNVSKSEIKIFDNFLWSIQKIEVK